MTEAAVPRAPLRATSTAVSRRLRRIGLDPWLLGLVATMVALGLVMVYSASWDVSYRLHHDPNTLFRRQLLFALAGLSLMMITARMPLRWLKRLALPIIMTAIAALVAVLLIHVGGGPRRAFLGGSVQPSEMAKLALIIYLAVWMDSKGERLKEWGYGLLPLAVIVGVMGSLIRLQPDLSAVITVGAVAFVMFILAGANIPQLALLTAGSAGVGFILIQLSTTGRQRLAEFQAGLVDINAASFHVQQSLQAFYSGGLLGRGLGASRGKFGLLPAPHTDSIFAVIGEELGLLGALLILALFCMFLWRGFRLAMEAPDRLGMLLAGGITFWIGLEALVNMAVLLGLLPFAGNALPFFSYGGSHLITTLTGVGFLLSVSRSTMRDTQVGGYVAPVDIGWRYRRRRVSRLGRRSRPRRAG